MHCTVSMCACMAEYKRPCMGALCACMDACYYVLSKVVIFSKNFLCIHGLLVFILLLIPLPCTRCVQQMDEIEYSIPVTRFLARATELYKSLFCPSIHRPSFCKLFLGFWLVKNRNFTLWRRSLRWMSSMKATYLLQQENKTNNGRLRWAVPH